MGHSLVSFSCLLNDIFIKILCADHLPLQKQQRAPFIPEISSTSLFHRNSSHLFSFFVPQPDPEPAGMIRFQWVSAEALGAGAVPGSAVAPLPFCWAVFGCPSSPPQSSSDLMDTHISAASPLLQCQAGASSGLHWISPSPAARKGRFHIDWLWSLLWQRSIYLRIIMVPRDVAVAIATITYCVEYQSKCYKEQEPLVVFINLMFLFWTKCDS